MLDASDDPRAGLWAELFSVAEEEQAHGDGRAMSALQRLRERLEGKKPVRRVYPDDGN